MYMIYIYIYLFIYLFIYICICILYIIYIYLEVNLYLDLFIFIYICIYLYIYILSTCIYLCIIQIFPLKIYIKWYVVDIIYLHDTKHPKETFELPDSPWHPHSNPKADHQTPCRALMSRISRWGPDSHSKFILEKTNSMFSEGFPKPIPFAHGI